MYIHFYYNENIFHEEKTKLTSNISTVASLLKEKKPIPDNLAHISKKFLIIETDQNENIVSISTNKLAITEYLNMKGVRVLVSNTVNDPIEAYKAYFDRNEVEYAFNILKQRLGGSRMRVAIMLRKRINNALKNNDSLKLHYDSELVVIDKLDTIEETKFSFGSYFTEVVGGLRKLLNAMEIPIPSEEVDNNIFKDADKYVKSDPIEEELPEDPYSDQYQLQ